MDKQNLVQLISQSMPKQTYVFLDEAYESEKKRKLQRKISNTNMFFKNSNVVMVNYVKNLQQKRNKFKEKNIFKVDSLLIFKGC